MNRRGARFVGVLFVSVAACSSHAATPKPSTPTPAASRTDLQVAASAVVDDLAAGRFNAVRAMLDANMKARDTAEALATDWIAYQKDYGGYRSHGTPKEVTLGDITVERVPITTATGTGEVRVSYHADRTIAGLYFLRAGAPPP